MKKFRLPYISRRSKITVFILLVLFTAAFFAIGWIFSSKVIELKPQTIDFDQTIQAIEEDRYTITGNAYDAEGIMGGIRSDGSMIGIFGLPLGKDAGSKTSTRKITDISGPKPNVGDKISLQGSIWTTDPKAALGIDYENINYDGPLGKMSAWLVSSPASTKWTIAIHGIGGHKREMLRFVKPVLAAGNNMMVIDYRGDENNPKSPDGYAHLGDTEWQDLEAAVRYARDHGATDVQLYGNSLGGSIAENYLRRSPDVATINISKVILDSPALDWDETLRFRARLAGYPSLVYYPAKVTMKLRAGIDINRITTKPEHIKHKTLLIHSADDQSVPQGPSKAIADARPDLVKFIDFKHGGHTRSWNHDPARYEQEVTDFLLQ